MGTSSVFGTRTITDVDGMEAQQGWRHGAGTPSVTGTRLRTGAVKIDCIFTMFIPTISFETDASSAERVGWKDRPPAPLQQPCHAPLPPPANDPGLPRMQRMRARRRAPRMRHPLPLRSTRSAWTRSAQLCDISPPRTKVYSRVRANGLTQGCAVARASTCACCGDCVRNTSAQGQERISGMRNTLWMSGPAILTNINLPIWGAYLKRLPRHGYAASWQEQDGWTCWCTPANAGVHGTTRPRQ